MWMMTSVTAAALSSLLACFLASNVYAFNNEQCSTDVDVEGVAVMPACDSIQAVKEDVDARKHQQALRSESSPLQLSPKAMLISELIGAFKKTADGGLIKEITCDYDLQKASSELSSTSEREVSSVFNADESASGCNSILKPAAVAGGSSTFGASPCRHFSQQPLVICEPSEMAPFRSNNHVSGKGKAPMDMMVPSPVPFQSIKDVGKKKAPNTVDNDDGDHGEQIQFNSDQHCLEPISDKTFLRRNSVSFSDVLSVPSNHQNADTDWEQFSFDEVKNIVEGQAEPAMKLFDYQNELEHKMLAGLQSYREKTPNVPTN